MQYKAKYPELANALYMALTNDPFYRVLEDSISGSAEDKMNAMLAYMDYSIIESMEFGECYIPETQNYGVSVWSKPIASKIEKEKKTRKFSFLKEFLGDKAVCLYRSACESMDNQAEALIPEQSWYLSIIGILPEFQGQGLGPGLVESVLEKSDKLGVGSFLETFTSRNKTFYQRLGYQTLGEFKEPSIDADYWLMYRPAIK